MCEAKYHIAMPISSSVLFFRRCPNPLLLNSELVHITIRKVGSSTMDTGTDCRTMISFFFHSYIYGVDWWKKSAWVLMKNWIQRYTLGSHTLNHLYQNTFSFMFFKKMVWWSFCSFNEILSYKGLHQNRQTFLQYQPNKIQMRMNSSTVSYVIN